MAKDTANQKRERKHFFKDFKAELKKVIWPTPKQIVNSTIAVITIVLITAAIVFVLDLTFGSLNKYGVNKLRDVVKNDETLNSIDNTSIENENTTDSTDVEENLNSTDEATEGDLADGE